MSEHNEVMPHAAFEGQTPDEMFFGVGATVRADLIARRARAREERIQANQAAATYLVLQEQTTWKLDKVISSGQMMNQT